MWGPATFRWSARGAIANACAHRMKPFLKWPGGKRWFVRDYPHFLPGRYNRYIEPFLGSGSVYFHLEPKLAVLSDTNPDVVAAFKGVKRSWRRVVSLLREHQRNHGSDYYYEVRAQNPERAPERAARVIYLNRTCFNGIYRVNRQGVFNVPKGTKTAVLLPDDNFEGAAKLLNSASIELCDFERSIRRAGDGDLVFADPPYTVRHNSNGFIKYNEKLFSWEDQERLAKALRKAKDRGAFIMSTNASHDSLRELYLGLGFHLLPLSRYSSISASADSRKRFQEIIISSHPLDESKADGRLEQSREHNGGSGKSAGIAAEVHGQRGEFRKVEADKQDEIRRICA